MTKFSQQFVISRSTVQFVPERVQMALDKACRITNALQMSLCTMTVGVLSPERTDILHSTLLVLTWYNGSPSGNQRIIRIAISVIFDELEK